MTKFFPLALEEILEEERFEMQFSEDSLPDDFLLVPWRSLFKSGKMELLEPLYVQNFSTTILKWEWTIPAIMRAIKRFGIKTIFCTSTYPNDEFKNYAYPDYARDSIVPLKKDIWMSLIGWENNALRRRIFQLYKDNPYFVPRTFFRADGIEPDFGKTYDEYLGRSRFSLCPKGITSGTKRFWESLRAGSIPILISDKMRLPSCWNWDDTCITVLEWKVMTLRFKLNSAARLFPEREELMRNSCLAAHSFFSNPASVTNYINTTLCQ